MKRQDLLKEMKESVGTKDPVVFFDKMVDVFYLLFDKIGSLEIYLKRNSILTSLAIQWDPKIAASMLVVQISTLRQDKMMYHSEISLLKDAYAKNEVTQSYEEFCNFWIDTLGWHPFLEYAK